MTKQLDALAGELKELRDFLNGEAPIKGEYVEGWFGERQKVGRFLSAAFWWRPEMKRRLDRAIKALRSAQDSRQTVLEEALDLLRRWQVWACGQQGLSPFQDTRDFLSEQPRSMSLGTDGGEG